MKKIKTYKDFQTIIQSSRAMIFVTFKWSSQARFSGAMINEWESTWSTWNPEIKTEIYELDGDLIPETKDWLIEIKELGGYGSLNWLEEGRLIQRVDYVSGAGIKQLSKLTNDLWNKNEED